MNADAPEPTAESPPVHPPTAAATAPPTPLSWRLGIAGAIAAVTASAWLLRGFVGVRGQALAGVFVFFAVVALFSTNLRAVNWRTIGWGIGLQAVLAVLVLKVPVVTRAFEVAAAVVRKFINF